MKPALLGDFAESLGVSTEVFVAAAAILLGIIVVLLWIIFIPRRKKVSKPVPLSEEERREELPPEEDLEELMAPIEEEEETEEDLETVMHFSPEKVRFEADVNTLTIRLINPAPKVVEKAVEIPVEKVIEKRVEVPTEAGKKPKIKVQLDVGKAQDMPSGVDTILKKYGLTSLVLLRGDGTLIAPESDEARGVAEAAAKVASPLGIDGKNVTRVEIAGRERRYILGMQQNGSLVLAALSAADGIDEVTLDFLSDDLKSLLGAHQP